MCIRDSFPDSALQQLEDGFLDDFRNGDWYGGFCDYIDGCAGLLLSLIHI